MKDMPAYCDEILELIDWARSHHHLNYIGIGNEDQVSMAFEQCFLMISKAIKQRYPDIKVIGTAGMSHNPSADYVEGWKFAKAHGDVVDLVDEHYYESTGWFLTLPDFYDDYDRKGSKVYLGEYVSRMRTMESALAEAAYLCRLATGLSGADGRLPKDPCGCCGDSGACARSPPRGGATVQIFITFHQPF